LAAAESTLLHLVECGLLLAEEHQGMAAECRNLPHVMQAAELVTSLRRAAHVVAVVEQDVLMQAFGDAQVGSGLQYSHSW
jgi:hypothetical protein